MMKLSFKKAKCRVEMDNFVRGSVLKGTVESGVSEFRTYLTVESDAPPDRLVLLIRNAKQGCYAESMITAAIPLKSYIEVNGQPFSLEGITAS